MQSWVACLVYCVLTGSPLDAINADRGSAGLPPLVENYALDEPAHQRAIFEQDQPDLTHSNWQASFYGLGCFWRGENLARGSAADIGAYESALMRSPKHRDNILHPSFTSVAVGVAVLGNTVNITQLFCGPKWQSYGSQLDHKEGGGGQI